MVCDICKNDKWNIVWSGGPHGNFALCKDCVERLAREHKTPGSDGVARPVIDEEKLH